MPDQTNFTDNNKSSRVKRCCSVETWAIIDRSEIALKVLFMMISIVVERIHGPVGLRYTLPLCLFLKADTNTTSQEDQIRYGTP